MSLLDLDERLLALAPRVELVHSPLADPKAFPADVDACLVEGAVSTSADLDLLLRVRERTRVVVALGDCATDGNVTAMRDALGGAEAVLRRAWAAVPGREASLPALVDPVRPLHAVVRVDAFLPGCPPSADAIHRALSGLLAEGSPALRRDG
jgi:NAD-reducing hydrogenase small subunit